MNNAKKHQLHSHKILETAAEVLMLIHIHTQTL